SSVNKSHSGVRRVTQKVKTEPLKTEMSRRRACGRVTFEFAIFDLPRVADEPVSLPPGPGLQAYKRTEPMFMGVFSPSKRTSMCAGMAGANTPDRPPIFPPASPSYS